MDAAKDARYGPTAQTPSLGSRVSTTLERAAEARGNLAVVLNRIRGTVPESSGANTPTVRQASINAALADLEVAIIDIRNLASELDNLI